MKVVILHSPMYPVNHEFFNILGEKVNLIVYQFGIHPVRHKSWTVEQYQKESNNYEIKVFGNGPVTFRLQANPIFLKNLKDMALNVGKSISSYINSCKSN